jgi:peptidoglycan hydrolase-like protein with peptidoglycan-binding domain
MAFLAGLTFAGAALAEQQPKEQVQVQISADQLSSEQILELQRSLQDQGIDPGPIDGKMGPLVGQGIQLFQQRQGLATTGDLNEQTLEALGLEPREFLGLSAATPEQRQARQQEMQGEPQFEISLNLLNSAQVRKLQQQLKDQGIDPGPVDGVMGPLTQQGIQVFQQRQGLAATGNLNQQTLNALDIETEEFMGLAPAFE